MKNIPCQEEAEQGGRKDENKNWALGAACKYCIILVMMEDA